MKVGIIVGLGLGIGIALLSGRTPSAAEAIAPPAAAPTPLVPETYTALSAPAAPAASTAALARLSPPAVAASTVSVPAVATPAVTVPAVAAPTITTRAAPSASPKFNQYHPYWVVDVH